MQEEMSGSDVEIKLQSEAISQKRKPKCPVK